MKNIAIIGAGSIADAHIASYKMFPEACRVTALCDLDPETMQEKKEKHRLQAAVYSDAADVFAKEEIDLVSICTPPYTHAAIAIAALDAGKHVLVEKPMAASLAECDLMNEAAARSGKVLAVVAQNRFLTPVMKLKHVLDTKLAGNILHTEVNSFWWRGRSYYDMWWRGTWEKEGGGCTLNHAVHHIDLFRWMNGMPKEVTAVTSNASHDNAEVEDISIAIGKYADGRIVQITSSVIHHGEEQQLVFQGEHARISLPWKVSASVSQENGFPVQNSALEVEIERAYEAGPVLDHEGHTGQIQDVLHAIDQGREPVSNGQEGRATLELIMAIYEAAATGRTVQLPLLQDSDFYTREKVLKHATYFPGNKSAQQRSVRT